LKQQVSLLNKSLEIANSETRKCRSALHQNTSDQQRAHHQMSELQAAMSHATLELQTARTTEVQLQQSLAEAAQELRMQQQKVADAQLRAESAEADLSFAEAETRSSLPQWQEQMQKAEAQLRTLSNQLREKDDKVREQEVALQRKDIELGTLELYLSEARSIRGIVEERLTHLQKAHDKLEDAHHRILAQNDSDARWQLVSLRAEHAGLQRRFEDVVKELSVLKEEHEELHASYRRSSHVDAHIPLPLLTQVEVHEAATVNAAKVNVIVAQAQQVELEQRVQATKAGEQLPRMVDECCNNVKSSAGLLAISPDEAEQIAATSLCIDGAEDADGHIVRNEGLPLEGARQHSMPEAQ